MPEPTKDRLADVGTQNPHAIDSAPPAGVPEVTAGGNPQKAHKRETATRTALELLDASLTLIEIGRLHLAAPDRRSREHGAKVLARAIANIRAACRGIA